MSPDSFRSRALECMLLARDARDSYHKSLLLSMAETWSALAQSAENIERYLDAREGAKRMGLRTVRVRARRPEAVYL